jgi:hypothetical protein
MRFSCLFTFVSLIAFSAAQISAQSQPNKNSSEAASRGASISGLNAGVDALPIPSNQRDNAAEQSKEKAQAGIPLNPPGSRVFVFDPATGRTRYFEDLACYTIRSYRVVRDSPDSDSTHGDGYTTCVPSARIRYYTAVAHEVLK